MRNPQCNGIHRLEERTSLTSRLERSNCVLGILYMRHGNILMSETVIRWLGASVCAVHVGILRCITRCCSRAGVGFFRGACRLLRSLWLTFLWFRILGLLRLRRLSRLFASRRLYFCVSGLIRLSRLSRLFARRRRYFRVSGLLFFRRSGLSRLRRSSCWC